MTMLAPPAPFSPARESWKSYMLRFNGFLEANDLSALPDNRKRAFFLCHCGPEVFEMAQALSEPAEVQKVPWATLQETLRAHYAPLPSRMVSRFEFWRRSQEEGETVDQYVAALRKAAAHCEYRNPEEAMLERLVLGLRDRRLQRRLLPKPNLTLKMVLEEARANEDSTDEGDEIQRLRFERKTGNPETGERPPFCARCGGDHPKAGCRFQDAICQRCERKGHIARACRASQPALHRQRQPATQTGFRKAQFPKPKRRETPQTTIGYISEYPCEHPLKKIHVTVLIEGSPCDMEVVTSSCMTIVSWKTIKAAVPELAKKQLTPQKVLLKTYQGYRIPVIGRGSFQVKFNNFVGPLQLTVVKDDRPSLLGLEWFDALGLGLSFQDDGIKELTKEFADVFNGSLEGDSS
ncbi:uncharacterized protein LOC117656925 [Pantherophis guttatus]|uniref:Uncharacterized protein LOC117656925 n=1 Tax=Pantherophis guttatus TaxID=94885 RepID=A0A6P9AUH4_PANGU|nr:uncharacterized protein LOC117656925 [Pantherophis guttatus]